MTKEISNQQSCIMLKNGIEVWIDDDQLKNLQQVLQSTTSKFIQINSKIINTAEITGVFSPTDIDAMHRKKRGEWKCEYLRWHARNDECWCWEEERRKRLYVN